MSRHDPQVRLQHMLEYAREAVTLMRGKTRADLDTDRALGLATLRCLEIVGEAAYHVPEAVRQQVAALRAWTEQRVGKGVAK